MLALAHSGLCTSGPQTSMGGRSLICGSHGLLSVPQPLQCLLHMDRWERSVCVIQSALNFFFHLTFFMVYEQAY